ncbi:hypothetical protein [Cryobacterium fucosi]|uniref:DUF3168 domain-containing protein n=1 Tax=Cryobacterium fucosi TaxID=1259157 RepID=A0A4R9B2L7_9MICO|nr:hypothetical protein [Cryobacterium fucosi]TFD74733.1 hypothetical protein E3T48_12470 [Cryobacterium fucosi]
MVEATQALAFKEAMFNIAVGLWAADTTVQVAFGHPGQTMMNDIVSFGELGSSQVPGPMGGQRSRDETLTLTVIFSIFRGGGADQEIVTARRGYALLGQLENYVRKTDTTVTGTVRSCFLASHASDGSTDPDVLAAGRLTTIAAQFVAVTRITTGS